MGRILSLCDSPDFHKFASGTSGDHVSISGHVDDVHSFVMIFGGATVATGRDQNVGQKMDGLSRLQIQIGQLSRSISEQQLEITKMSKLQNDSYYTYLKRTVNLRNESKSFTAI